MPLSRPWRDLDRDTVSSAPDRLGVYELGDGTGTVLAVEAGVLRDELKTALAYGDGQQVRWQETQTREQAESLVAEHRDRLDS